MPFFYISKSDNEWILDVRDQYGLIPTCCIRQGYSGDTLHTK